MLEISVLLETPIPLAALAFKTLADVLSKVENVKISVEINFEK